MRNSKPGTILTYEQVVTALREAKRLGDCVPEDIEGTARAIIDGRLQKPYHVVVRMPEPQPSDSVRLEDTIDALKTFTLGSWGAKSAVVRQETEKVIAGSRPEEFAGAIGDWVAAHFQFMRDPALAEVVPTPEWMMTQIAACGHCLADGDDVAVLVAAMCLSVGLETQFVAVGFDGKPPSHVFTRVKKPTGLDLWIAIDPIAGKRFEEFSKRVTDSRIFPIEEGS
jgi:hypothetical protein